MDSVQKQVSTLSGKVDALYELIEQLSLKLSDVASDCKFGTEQIHRLESEATSSSRYSLGYSTIETTMEHKDVLADTNSFEPSSQSGERLLAPEIQIQRLTAQLTAAYNRIAALEEQLLSQRIH